MKPDMNKTKSQGTAVDLINGPIMKNLLIFMLPILISYVFQQLYNAVDTAIVGHFLGEQSLAAVGANVAIFDLMVSAVAGKRPLYRCVQSVRGRR